MNGIEIINEARERSAGKSGAEAATRGGYLFVDVAVLAKLIDDEIGLAVAAATDSTNAYWTGNDDGAYGAARIINEALDGQYDGAGVCRQPLQLCRERVAKLVKAMSDLRDCGVRHDLSPTTITGNHNYLWWCGYVKSIDTHVRSMARRALEAKV